MEDYLHENTLVSEEMRKSFGTHSTPQWLVDYVLWQLSPWIREMNPADRHVLEPGCGHSPFLVGAVRQLGQFASADLPSKGRAEYLRKHVHGIERDDFAREIGRLSLTLADVPNPNGWDLKSGNMFAGSTLADQVKRARIVLSNPPFEDFKDKDIRELKPSDRSNIAFKNKAAEMFARIIEHLPVDGVFGVIMPQSILTSDNSRMIREQMTREYELREICLLPDGVFGKSAAESVVLIGRRRVPSGRHTVRYRRVRAWGLKSFKAELEPSTETTYPQAGFLLPSNVSLRLPDLQEVWEALKHHTPLGTSFSVQKGFEFKSEADLKGRVVESIKRKPGWAKAYMRADDSYSIWTGPKVKWVDFSPEVVRRSGAGITRGVPQIVVNYAGPQGPWCRKAFIDDEGALVSSRFLAIRPKPGNSIPLLILWAILNSPVANAFRGRAKEDESDSQIF